MTYWQKLRLLTVLFEFYQFPIELTKDTKINSNIGSKKLIKKQPCAKQSFNFRLRDGSCNKKSNNSFHDEIY